MAMLIVLLLLAVATGLMFVLGAGLLAVIPLVVLVAVAAWLLWAFAAGRPPSSVSGRFRKAELLGPGGPDDPDRTGSGR